MWGYSGMDHSPTILRDYGKRNPDMMNMRSNSLTRAQERLIKISTWTYVCLFGAIFGYTINRNILLVWVAFMIIGGILLMRKYWLIKPIVRVKVTILEIATVVFLDILVISNLFLFIPGVIKEIILFLSIIALLSYYFSQLYRGNLTLN